jgi:cell division septal protein FtsQ
MTQEELVALTGFEEGKNLFQLDLDQANRKISAVPEVRSVTLERLLPDTMKVKIERRVPIFLFAESGDHEESFVSGKSFLCDREGVLMQPSRLDAEFLNLPVLRGVSPGTTHAGGRLENDRLVYAMKLQQALLEIPELDLKIRSIDVSKEYAAVVTDASHAEFTFGNDDLPSQMDRLKKLLAYYQNIGRTIKTANLMVARNTPVTFVLTSETASARITPLSATKKSNHH